MDRYTPIELLNRRDMNIELLYSNRTAVMVKLFDVVFIQMQTFCGPIM